MLLVYTHKITPRLTYIFRHYFVRILQIPVSFTTEVSDFVAHNGLKITYTKSPLGNEFFIRSHSILFEQGVNEVDFKVEKWDDIPCFFKTDSKSSIPFDIFAAGFYLISRYEEYLPHVKDERKCFCAKDSIAFKNNFLEKPIVDIWAYKLLSFFKEKFENYEYKKRNFKHLSTINVQRAYAYKNQGIARITGSILVDLSKLNLKKIGRRIITILGFRKDPFDTFSRLIYLKKRYAVTTLFFFPTGNYTLYDRNISFRNSHLQSLIKSIADYAQIGLLASYFTINDEDLIKKEKERLESIVNIPIKKSRQYFLRFNLPETYQHLIDLDFEEDYSMSYKNCVGFRAGTCTPFYFYDLDFEIQTPLKVFSPVVSDTTLKNELKLTNRECLNKIINLLNEVKKVNGTFVSLFHNEALSEMPEWEGWRVIYDKMLEKAK